MAGSVSGLDWTAQCAVLAAVTKGLHAWASPGMLIAPAQVKLLKVGQPPWRPAGKGSV